MWNKAYLISAKDEHIRKMATSGGFCKAFICSLLDYDYNAIITRMNGVKAETIITDKKENILTNKTNSCYVENPSYIDAIREINPREHYVAVGLPCQVRKLPGNCLRISLLCNHEPTKAYTDWLGMRNGITKVKDIIFRNNSKECIINGQVCDWEFSEEFIPLKCQKCKEIGFNSDILVGDPHGLGVKNKTLVLAMNTIAVRLIEHCPDIEIKEITRDEVYRSQGNHFKRKALIW